MISARSQTGMLAAVLLAAAATGSAQTQSSIPSYYDQLQFNLTSPAAHATAIGGYANPAVYGMLPGGEMIFSWSDHENSFSKMKEWGFFLGSRLVGLGVVRDRVTLPSGDRVGVNDWRLAFAGGSRDVTLGIGYGWSTADDELAGRSNIFQVGVVRRYGRLLSVGAAGSFATEGGHRSGLFDVAVRPLGDPTLTVFADAELPRGVSAKDAPWSVGARLEIVPGVELTGRYFENENYAFSVGISLGGLKLTGSPRYDNSDNVTNTTYEVRTGFTERTFLDEYTMGNKSYLQLHPRGAVKYRAFKYFDEGSHPLFPLLTDLEHAKNDRRVAGVALNLSGVTISRGKAWEVRQKLVELRAAGKHVVVFADDLDMTTYHLASAADRIVMDPEGIAVLPGYVMGRTFIREMLQKIGLNFDEWRFLKYKSAAEVLSRDRMTDADREQRLRLLEDLYATVRSEVSDSRGVPPETFDQWINDQILFSSKEALEVGMVDRIGRWDDVKDVIEELEGTKKRYRSRGALAANQFPSRLWGENPKIAIVYALGACQMDEGIHARRLEKIFLRLKDDRSVKAVVFRVDSPGGLALAADVAAAAMKKCAEKKPVIITQGDVAASGGYWLSIYGTEIYALPTTITGSIGVIGGWLWNDGIGEKLGHTSDHVKVGDHADFGFGIRLLLSGPVIPDRNLTPDERDMVMEEMEIFYNAFVEKVAGARGMPVDDVHGLAQGRVYSGEHAKTLGLVDAIGGLSDAVAKARAAAGIGPGDEVTFVEYPRMAPFRLRGRTMGLLGGLLGLGGDDEEPSFLDKPEWLYLHTVIARPGRPLHMMPPDVYVHEPRR